MELVRSDEAAQQIHNLQFEIVNSSFLFARQLHAVLSGNGTSA